MTDGGVPVDAQARMPTPGYLSALPSSGGHATVRARVAGGQREPARPAPVQSWPLLADALFCIVHDDGFNGGALRIAEATAALGLAGALLAELAWRGRVDVTGDGLLVVSDRTVPSDAAAHSVFADIVSEPRAHPVSMWVQYVATTSYGLVAKRMVQQGRVREEITRRLFRRSTVYVPVSMGKAAWPAARLADHYHRNRLDDVDCVLTGLVCAVGLAHHVFFDIGEADIVALPRLVDFVPPPLPDLVRQVHATVGSAVLAAR